MFKGNTCISINILSQPIATITSSVSILYLRGCVKFYPKDGQDWLHCGFKTHHITFCTELVILNPKIVIITHYLTTWSVRKVSDRIFLCEHLMDYNLARLHELTLNLSAHA